MAQEKGPRAWVPARAEQEERTGGRADDVVPVRPREIDLVGAVSGIVHLLRRLLRGMHDLRVAAEAPVPVFADPIEIGQAVLNLVTNARDSMPDGGTISIRVQALSSGEARRLGSRIDGRMQAILEVEGRGTGIPPEILDRMFEPFFTTG